MILLINICKEKLHFNEFVKPIKDILLMEGFDSYVKDYDNVSQVDLNNADKIIICGTSLLDDEFLDNVDKFKWLLDYKKPVLGICGGMQVIGLVFGGKLKKAREDNRFFKKKEVGFYNENFNEEFLGLKGKVEVYHLHNNYVDFSPDFDISCMGHGIAQAVKHNSLDVYGVLFHPEVRQKDLIRKFCSK